MSILKQLDYLIQLQESLGLITMKLLEVIVVEQIKR